MLGSCETAFKSNNSMKWKSLPSYPAGGQRCPALACSAPVAGALENKWPFPVCPGHWQPYPDRPSSGGTAAPACLRSHTITHNMTIWHEKFYSKKQCTIFFRIWRMCSNLLQCYFPSFGCHRGYDNIVLYKVIAEIWEQLHNKLWPNKKHKQSETKIWKSTWWTCKWAYPKCW